MDGLRWLLLLFGILVIAGVYFYSRREREKPEKESLPDKRVAPTLGEEPAKDEPQVEPEADELPAADVEEPAREQQPKIVTLRIVKRSVEMGPA